jgi:hypothetical protein
MLLTWLTFILAHFIETSDIARVHEDGTFEIMWAEPTKSELRGCNLMVN